MTQTLTKTEIMNKAGNLPRYTSYPTANHFSEKVTSTQSLAWVSSISSSQDVSLYLHIPFCRQLCWYCGCNTSVTHKEDPIYKYLSLLESEIAIIASHLDPSIRVTHIHFGGGSPTIVPAGKFCNLMDIVKTSFTVSDHAEIAIEMDPREISEAKVAAYAKAGVNRASLGVQDFDLNVQRSINRIQPFRQVYDKIELLRSYGIENINVDLIYGLPNQSKETIHKTLEKTVLLSPSRVSLFGYAHVPWMKKHMKLIDETKLPKSEERMEFFELASELLIKAGYRAVGLDHFVRPDDTMARALETQTLKRNFQGYTIDTAKNLIGLGVSAISQTEDGYWQNFTDLKHYRAAIRSGVCATGKGLAVNEADLFCREVIEQLMCYYRVDRKSLSTQSSYYDQIWSAALEQLRPLEAQGIVKIENEQIILLSETRQFVRLVAASFDQYLTASKNKHAQVA
ncbi:oxygen-independent coproporphyrinogen III oxidase [Temperatibacter marinus]|uniref:Coproporphyrinogen-III oxidase n=1 Tax=Temperatibacter marinus TaxID=1456591 RepID=A0AA52H926_9PROT|nr:oxygen-independent coproporphyrinogen III oxidase [Temperatibacter marinus]WND02439.1 oxygen-independent coproporphyrinogen III oxidase [Temperatibacter marinus]